MSSQVPEEISSAEARERFTDIVDAAAYKNQRLILKRNKKKMCAIVPMEDLELLERFETDLDLREALKAIEENQGQDTLSKDEIRKQLGL